MTEADARSQPASGPDGLRVRLGGQQWLLDLTTITEAWHDRVLAQELSRLPHGGMLYLIDRGDPSNLARSLAHNAPEELTWRVVRTGNGVFEAVIRRPYR